MGYRFNLTFVQQEGRFDQSLPITGGAGVHDLDPFGKPAVNIPDCPDGRAEGIPLVVMIKGIQKGSVLTHQRGFRGGGACVDP